MLKRILTIYSLAALVALVTGSAVAFFLWLLDRVIDVNFKHPWLLFLLPIGGIVIHVIYRLAGESSERGNSLIIEEIHTPGGGVPKRMAPVILLTTLITQLFGGSVGREGTAVQMGGSIAAAISGNFKMSPQEGGTILIAGVAAGFGAVFGTPLTGAVFAIEILIIKRSHFKAFFPALLASVLADLTVSAWGVQHLVYGIDTAGSGRSAQETLFLVIKVIVAAAAFGLVALFFIKAVQGLKVLLRKFIKRGWMIPVLGGALIICLTLLLNRPDYLGLGVRAPYPGVVTLPSAFQEGGADTWSWLAKFVYTVITIASGFKGGEVTPLFYIGATLGNLLAAILDAPVSLFAAIGFIAVFAGATNTPFASTVMGAELFGSQYVALFALACFTAYLFSGRAAIYNNPHRPAFTRFSLREYLKQKVGKYRVANHFDAS